MTNQEQIQSEINSIVENNPNHYSKQYKIAKWQETRLQELGILNMMPSAPYRAGYIGHSDANAVIEAAEDSGKQTGGFSDGEGWEHTSKPSKLNQLLNENEDTKRSLTTANKCHTRTQKSQYVTCTIETTLEYLMHKAILTPDHKDSSSTIHFGYDEDTKLWCFAGETISGLGWETDDYEAENETEAMKQAISFLQDYDY